MPHPMNSPQSPDPLLQALNDDAAHLPIVAAAEARRSRTRRLNQVRGSVMVIALLFMGIACWQSWPRLGHQLGPSKRQQAKPVTPVTVEQGFVIVQTEEEARRNPPPLPPDVSQDDKGALNSLAGVPVLIVKDQSGRSQLHIIER